MKIRWARNVASIREKYKTRQIMVEKSKNLLQDLGIDGRIILK
jgi:uncharacterized protein YjiS (DUF1127 family)